MEEFEEVTITSRHGTGPAIVDTIRTKAGKYVRPDIAVTDDAPGEDAITLSTYAVDLITLLATMTEPSARVTWRRSPDDSGDSSPPSDPGWLDEPPFSGA